MLEQTKMRRKDRELTREQTRKILQTGSYGVLSLIREDGYPYGVPVNYVLIDTTIYFHCAKGVGKKQECIAKNPCASFTVVTKEQVVPSVFGTDYESAIAYGTVAAVADKRAALLALIEKYCQEYREEGLAYIDKMESGTDVYAFTIESVTGKACHIQACD